MKVLILCSGLAISLIFSACGRGLSEQYNLERNEGELLVSDSTNLSPAASVPEFNGGDVSIVPTVLATGGLVPGLENEVLVGLSSVDINKAGQISVVAEYGYGSNAGTALLYGEVGALNPILVSGQNFPNKPETVFVSESFGTLDEDGRLYVNVFFTGDNTSSGLFERVPGNGTIEPIAQSGDLLKGFEEPLKVRSIGKPAVSGRGASFKVNLTDSTSGGLFLWDRGEVLPVAPGFFTEAQQDQFRISGTNCNIVLDESEVVHKRVVHDTLPDGSVVFHANLIGNETGVTCSTNAIVLFNDGVYSVLAESGGIVPGTTDAIFREIHLQSVETNGDIYFYAELEDSRVSHWVYTNAGDQGLIFIGGEEVEIGTRVEFIDKRQSFGKFRPGTNTERRISARIELENGSVSVMVGTARLDQPYPTIEGLGAAALMPILTTLEPLHESFEDTGYFTGIGTVLNRGINGVLFEAIWTNTGDNTNIERGIWLHTPESGFKQVVVTEEQAVGQFLNPFDENELFVTNTGAVYLSIRAANTDSGSGLFQILGRYP